MNAHNNSHPAVEERSSATVSSGRRVWQARIMRVINVPMRLLLRLPFPTPLSRQLMLITFRGRKTGKRYVQPVSFVRDGDVLLTPGGGRWKLNLRDGVPVRLHLQGRDVIGRPELIGQVDEVERLLRRMMQLNPRVASFVPVRGQDGQIDPTKLTIAVRHGFRVVRWHINDPDLAREGQRGRDEVVTDSDDPSRGVESQRGGDRWIWD